eukprot:535304_1
MIGTITRSRNEKLIIGWCNIKFIKSFIFALWLVIPVYFVLYENISIKSNIGTSYAFSSSKKSLCTNPTSLMWEYSDLIAQKISSRFQTHGFEFNYNCSLNYPNSFASNGKLYTSTGITHFTCQKYNNHSINYSPHFCDGGRIFFLCAQQSRYNKPMLTFTLDRYGINVVTKFGLDTVLSIYCNEFYANDNVCDFKLLSYHMDDSFQRIKFLTDHIDCTKSESELSKTWVFKEDKDVGIGVHFVQNDQHIYKLIAPNKTEQTICCKECEHIQPLKRKTFLEKEGFWFQGSKLDNGMSFRVKRDGLLIQEFISNELLLENKRFHVRAMLLVIWQPLIVLYYPEGCIFRSAEDLVLKTNTHVAHHTKAYINGDMNDIDLYWSYSRLQRYLNDVYGNEVFNYTRDKLQKDILHIAMHTFKANEYYNMINGWSYNDTDWFNGNIDMTWNILCMDIAITDNFELKLMELNSHCGFYICCENNPIECDEFTNDSADVLLEIYEKKHDNISIKNIENLGRFEIAFMQQ